MTGAKTPMAWAYSFMSSSTAQIIIGYLCFDCCCLCCVSMPQIILQSEIIQSCLYKNCLTHYSHSQLMVELVCGNRATPTIYLCIYVKSTTQQCLSISLNQIYINSNSQSTKYTHTIIIIHTDRRIPHWSGHSVGVCCWKKTYFPRLWDTRGPECGMFRTYSPLTLSA